jgi:hypothetical protein
MCPQNWFVMLQFARKKEKCFVVIDYSLVIEKFSAPFDEEI